jgi:Zn-dependent protease
VIALGGPVLGTAGAAALGLAGHTWDSQLLIALADFGFMINLFNLMPIGQLDGGRIGAAISPLFGVAGLGAGGYMLYAGMVSNPIFYLVMAGGAYTTTSRLLGWDADSKPKNYYKIAYGEQASLFALYAGLIATAMYAMRENNKRRKTPRQLEAERRDPWAASEAPWETQGQGDGAVYDDFFEDDSSSSSSRRW